MNILPITNTQTITKPNFGQKSMPRLQKADAQLLLDNYESITREHFKDGYIYTGIAQLSFAPFFKDGKQNIENFKNLFIHALINLGLKVEELRSDIAFKEAIKEFNSPLLELMIKYMQMRPITPDKKVDTHIIFEGIYSGYGQLKELLAPFSNKINKEAFGKYVPPVRDNSAKLTFLEQAKNMLSKEEETEGMVSLNTIYKIVSNPDFNKIKDESLNISGSKILHILPEVSFDENNKEEINLVHSIINKCSKAGYDFGIKNNFGETAKDKAIESENNFLIKLLNNYSL